MRAQGPSPGFREWDVELSVDITPEVLARAVALVHDRWGASALVVGSEGRTLRVHGPDSESAIRDLRFALERPLPERVLATRRTGRRRR